MKYITSMQVSMPAKTNLDKAKTEFSFLGEPKEIYREIYEYNGFKIEDAFNEPIFLKEFNESVNFKLDIYFLDCAFVFVAIHIDSKKPLDIKVLNNNAFFFKKREELKKIKIDSIAEIFDKLILSRYYNLKSFANILDNIDLDMNHPERWNEFIKTANDNTCIISNRYNFTISSSSGTWYIEENNQESSELLIDQTKVKLWENKNIYYFNGDVDKLVIIRMHEAVALAKLSNGVHVLEVALNQIADQAKEILKKITNTNPAYWEDLSIVVEAEQLYYIETQSLVYSTIEDFRNSSYLKNQLTEKKYNKLKEVFDRKIELIFQLSNEVNAALQSISTPVKSKNDFKLQESTDKVNDRILFLSFIAMSVPLISWVTSTDISNNIKLISGFVILLLPFLYHALNSLYKSRLSQKNKLNVFKDQLKEQYKNIENQKKKIKTIQSYDKDKQRIYSIQIEASESNIKIHKEHIKKLKEKIQKM